MSGPRAGNVLAVVLSLGLLAFSFVIRAATKDPKVGEMAMVTVWIAAIFLVAERYSNRGSGR